MSILLMQILEYLENRFDNLSLKVKIELFLFPLVLLSLVFFLFDDFSKEKRIIKKEKTFVKKMNKKTVDIVKDIEKLAKKKQVNILNITTGEKNINIELEANKNKQVLFIDSLEKYNSFSKIKELVSNAQTLSLVLDFDSFYIKKPKKNLELLREEKLLKKIKLIAVVNNRAYINNQWFSLNEDIGEYKIMFISNSKVILNNGSKDIELSLNEYL